ncbi:MAG: biotin/lipoyl-binding protein, partial [Oceanibaculum nanhaiense]|nr:biotin/lipoyl-binding protein [Oceanibaculum nanhaiense]
MSLPQIASGKALNAKSKTAAQPFPELQTHARGPIMAGMIIIAVMFGGFGIWSGVAQLDSAVVAGGVVSVDGQRKAIQHLEGGIVADILVADGDKVEKDQVLVRLDPVRPRTSPASRAISRISSAVRDSRSLPGFFSNSGWEESASMITLRTL